MEQPAEALEDRARSRDGTRVEQCQEKFRVVSLQFAEVLDIANLVPDDDTEITERLQEAVDEPFFRGPDAAPKQQQQVDVGMQAEMTATVATKGDNGQRPVVGPRLDPHSSTPLFRSFLRGPDAAPKQQQQVDVGMQAEMTATVATKGDNGQRPVVGPG